MPAGREALAGLRILVVEDELLVAMLVEEMLAELGCEIVGPVSTLDEALAAAERNRLDGALLDANLRGKSSAPAAETLTSRNLPFLLVTGYGSRAGDPPVLRDAPRLRKPFTIDELAQRMTAVFVDDSDH